MLRATSPSKRTCDVASALDEWERVHGACQPVGLEFVSGIHARDGHERRFLAHADTLRGGALVVVP